jgi:hypothetical protein
MSSTSPEMKTAVPEQPETAEAAVDLKELARGWVENLLEKGTFTSGAFRPRGRGPGCSPRAA